MSLSRSMQDIRAVSRASGIEESRIRFYEMEFKDLFEASAMKMNR